MSDMPRGLTLIEALAATVLLGMIVAACVPALQGAATGLAEPVWASRSSLGAFADDVMKSPQLAGLENFRALSQTKFPAPQFDPPFVELSLLAADRNIDHGWLRVSCGPAAVYRWISLREAAADTDQLQ